MKIGVINSDSRQKAIAEQLQSYGIEVYRIESEEDLRQYDVLVLPIKGCNERYEVSLHTGTLQLDQYFKQYPDIRIFTGIPNRYLDTLAVPVIYLMEIEEVVLQNAVLTAQGVLAEVIRYMDIPLRQLEVDIIGYGRCGKEIVELLSPITSCIRVIVKENRVSEIRTNIANEVLSYEQWCDMTPSMLIINTAPSKVITQEIMQRWHTSPIILDIASSPGGVDYPYAISQNIQAILLPSLPSIYSPISAGKILADAIYKELL
ncbi:MAG: hypothetical protein E7191_03715 [Erysipelotrichaceae bacterium]|nr:hypothetical protein [Erysipelotrichaceae bacterium]